jgi:hypothetical protein
MVFLRCLFLIRFFPLLAGTAFAPRANKFASRTLGQTNSETNYPPSNQPLINKQRYDQPNHSQPVYKRPDSQASQQGGHPNKSALSTFVIAAVRAQVQLFL